MHEYQQMFTWASTRSIANVTFDRCPEENVIDKESGTCNYVTIWNKSWSV